MTAGISGVVLAGAVKFFGTQLHQQRQQGFRIEAQQAARSSLDAVTRDLRLAGACLPSDGQFIALGGANIPGGDSITIRTGLVRTNMSCIITTLTAGVAAGTSALPVQSGSGFVTGMLGYIKHPNGSGEIVPVANANATTVTFTAPMSQDYPVGTGVYAIDERTYAVDKSNPSLPVLTLTVNRALPEAFAAGVADFQIDYVLDRHCPTCDRVPLPANTAEWRLVNEVALSATVQTVGGVQPQDQAMLVVSSMAKPRNLLP